jgi:hypothetical protein
MRIYGLNIIKVIYYHFKTSFISPLPIRIYFFQVLMRKLGTFKQRLKYDAILYPAYAYGMYCAALQAKSLGLNKISAIEFGVGTGNGLIAMEKHAIEIYNLTGVEFEIYGFDSGKGLPKPTDYRDQGYFWNESDFVMDQKKLENNLSFSNLVIGDIKSTIDTFINDRLTFPIGFISFDLDYYSSTIASFEIFKINDDLLLPRIECYMDDVSSTDLLVASRGTGVLRAIGDFNNSTREEKKIFRKKNVSHSRRIPSSWNKKVYVFHSFDHSKYNDTVSSI